MDPGVFAALDRRGPKPRLCRRYRNTDPVLINYLTRLAVEKRGEDYFSFPQRALFERRWASARRS